MVSQRMKYWGWGYENNGLNKNQVHSLIKILAEDFGVLASSNVKKPEVSDIKLHKPKLIPPDSLLKFCTNEPYERVLHSFGQSQPDSIRIFDGDFKHAPDVIAYPERSDQINAIYDWAGGAGAAIVPYGGGSSVVGGVTPDIEGHYKGTVMVNMTKLNKVLEVDETSRAALIQGGAKGPELENQLKPYNLTLRHFPQSFEHSTLGGWIATRSGGHFATLYTHIDDLVENITSITPSGCFESRRLPGSGSGPSPDRFIMGTEGALGIITEAWVRLQGRPVFKLTAGFRFAKFLDASLAVRSISQSGLFPANVRIVDATELQVNGAGDGTYTLMVVSFESSDHSVEPWMKRAEECCLDHGGIIDIDWRENPDTNLKGAVGAWRDAFIRMPYNRENLTPRGIISDTFETAITWDKFEEFYWAIKDATQQAIRDVTGQNGAVSCRFSHAYPDGPAPYFAFHCTGKPGGMLEQWKAIKYAASEALIKNGGTITHHHAVGRDHQKWYEKQRPKLFGHILRDAKNRLDPDGIMNPGVVV